MGKCASGFRIALTRCVDVLTVIERSVGLAGDPKNCSIINRLRRASRWSASRVVAMKSVDHCPFASTRRVNARVAIVPRLANAFAKPEFYNKWPNPSIMFCIPSFDVFMVNKTKQTFFRYEHKFSIFSYGK